MTGGGSRAWDNVPMRPHPNHLKKTEEMAQYTLPINHN